MLVPSVRDGAIRCIPGNCSANGRIAELDLVRCAIVAMLRGHFSSVEIAKI